MMLFQYLHQSQTVICKSCQRASSHWHWLQLLGMVAMLGNIVWACLWCCWACGDELSQKGTMNLDPNTLSSSWWLGSWGWLSIVCIEICSRSSHFLLALVLHFVAISKVVLVWARMWLVCWVGLCLLLLWVCLFFGYGRRSLGICRPESRLVIRAMTLHAWGWCWERYLIRYPSFFPWGWLHGRVAGLTWCHGQGDSKCLKCGIHLLRIVGHVWNYMDLMYFCLDQKACLKSL